MLLDPKNQERILSIQSHVAFGYVGGKAAVFPLQCLGFDVDVVNTVNFSNHSGYGRFGGTRTTADDLERIFQHMEENGLLSPTRLLTGYVPGAPALAAVAQLATTLRQRNPDLVYLLDPVLGDAGKLYVAPDVIPIYRSLLPQATVITPNWFEVEVLTQIELKDMSSLRAAIRILHDEYKVPNVVVSSIALKPWLFEALPLCLRPTSPDHPSPEEISSEYLLSICSSNNHANADPVDTSSVHVYLIPFIPGYFSGVGDLFSALVLAHLQPDPKPEPDQTPLSRATTMAIDKTHAILELTQKAAKLLPEEDRLPTDDEQDAVDVDRVVRRMRGRELKLIQGQDIIRSKDLTDKSRRMEPWTTF